jgi:hypothetical protein
VSDTTTEEWQKDAREAREYVRRRFPDFRCVRCNNDKFLMRVWRDVDLQPAFRDNRIVEYICDNCGLVERHVVAGLAGELAPVRQELKDEND